MLNLLSLVVLGFFLGMRHATDADHVVAVATIVGREKKLRSAAVIGVLWGLGHGASVALAGGLIILFGLAVPARLGLAAEFAVGIMLVLLGVWSLISVWRAGRAQEPLPAGVDETMHFHPAPEPPTLARAHAHVHRHGDLVHSHPHTHVPGGHGHGATVPDRLDARFGRWGSYRTLRPVAIGLVHGLAGSAAIALLVLGTVSDPWWALAYLLVFGIGTICGMLLLTLAIAAPFAATASRPALTAGLRGMSGALSLAFGLFMMYQIGVVDGLFSAAPQWDPH